MNAKKTVNANKMMRKILYVIILFLCVLFFLSYVLEKNTSHIFFSNPDSANEDIIAAITNGSSDTFEKFNQIDPSGFFTYDSRREEVTWHLSLKEKESFRKSKIKILNILQESGWLMMEDLNNYFEFNKRKNEENAIFFARDSLLCAVLTDEKKKIIDVVVYTK